MCSSFLLLRFQKAALGGLTVGGTHVENIEADVPTILSKSFLPASRGKNNQVEPCHRRAPAVEGSVTFSQGMFSHN